MQSKAARTDSPVRAVPKALSMTDDEWVGSIGGTIKLARAARREAASELDDLGLSQREIAAALGVSPGTVNKDLKPPVQNRTPEEQTPPLEQERKESSVQNRTPEEQSPVASPSPKSAEGPREDKKAHVSDGLCARPPVNGTANRPRVIIPPCKNSALKFPAVSHSERVLTCGSALPRMPPRVTVTSVRR